MKGSSRESKTEYQGSHQAANTSKESKLFRSITQPAHFDP